MFPTISIGGAVLPTGPLVLILGVWLALAAVERAAKWLSLDVNNSYNLASTGIIAGIIAARLAFVAAHWSAYQSNLLGIIWPINTGYTPWAGLFIGLAAAFFYGRAKQLPPAATLDALLPAAIIGLIFLALADFLGGPGYGEVTSMPWGISQYGIRRHPVQLYQLLFGLAALLIWWRLRPQRRHDGQLALVGTGVYSAGILLADAFRANPWLTTGGYHVSQIIALLLLLLCLGLLTYLTPSQESAAN